MPNEPLLNQDEEYQLPCAEALLAGTLALMTAHVQACDTHRVLMARRIGGQLRELAAHPMLSPQFKTMLWNLGARWGGEGGQTAPEARPASERPLWHATPDTVQ